MQRKAAAQTPEGMVNARRYLSSNANAAQTAIELHLKQQRLPQPHPRMQWHDEAAFYESLFVAFNSFARSFEHPEDFAQAMFPGDPFGLIDSMRPIAKLPAEQATNDVQTMFGGAVGPWTWLPGIGTALAQMVEQAVIQSRYRLGARWLASAEQRGPASGTVSVDENTIARSHPMDRYVRTAMCRPNVFTVTPEASAAKKPATKTKSDGAGVRRGLLRASARVCVPARRRDRRGRQVWRGGAVAADRRGFARSSRRIRSRCVHSSGERLTARSARSPTRSPRRRPRSGRISRAACAWAAAPDPAAADR